MFERNGVEWVETARLTPEGEPVNRYSSTVAISGDRLALIVGESSDTLVYVFRKQAGEWTREAVLEPSGAPATRDAFGAALAMRDDLIVVGAPLSECELGVYCGAAYVFERVGTRWFERAKLIPEDRDARASFGNSVALSGDAVVIGSYLDDDECPELISCDSGSAYVFRRSGATWVQEAKITALDAAGRTDFGPGDYFGTSVAIDGEYLLVGAYQNSDAGARSGSAYVFKRYQNNWLEFAKLTAGDAAEGDRFGFAVALEGPVAVVSALNATDSMGHYGAVYVFRRVGETWIEDTKLYADPGSEPEHFGRSIALGGGYVVGGSSLRADGVESSRTAHFFAAGGDCDGNAVTDACDILANAVDDCTGNGTPDVCEPDCNGNGTADSCDTISGFSEDCTGNEIPDECEPDCNGNGSADSCDLADGTSRDRDANGIPDECDVFGDATDDGKVDMFDILCTLDVFMGAFTECTLEQVDFAPCEPDGTIDIRDIFAVLDAFRGIDLCPER